MLRWRRFSLFTSASGGTRLGFPLLAPCRQLVADRCTRPSLPSLLSDVLRPALPSLFASVATLLSSRTAHPICVGWGPGDGAGEEDDDCDDDRPSNGWLDMGATAWDFRSPQQRRFPCGRAGSLADLRGKWVASLSHRWSVSGEWSWCISFRRFHLNAANAVASSSAGSTNATHICA